MPDLFISYARGDSRDFVARLSAALEDRGKDTWVDLDDIPAASVWNDDLRAGIASSDSFCFVISPSSVVSEHCRAELEHAVALGKRLLPVLLLPVPDAGVPEAVASRNWIPQVGRFTDDFDAALDTLVTAIETDLDWVREHTRWGVRAEEWVRRGEDRSVLARGSDLDQAEAFVSGGGGHEPQPTEAPGPLRPRQPHGPRAVASASWSPASRWRLCSRWCWPCWRLLQRNTAVEQRHEAESSATKPRPRRAARHLASAGGERLPQPAHRPRAERAPGPAGRQQRAPRRRPRRRCAAPSWSRGCGCQLRHDAAVTTHVVQPGRHPDRDHERGRDRRAVGRRRLVTGSPS